MEGSMSTKARELAEQAIWDYSEYAVSKGTKAIEAGEDVVTGAIDRAFLKSRITQAIQQALDEQASTEVALRGVVEEFFEAHQIECYCGKCKALETALTQSSPRAAQIMAVVQATKDWYDAYCNKEGPVWHEKEQALLQVMDSFMGNDVKPDVDIYCPETDRYLGNLATDPDGKRSLPNRPNPPSPPIMKGGA
jgi:hypothetical protein